MRKVLGSERSQLILQFLSESLAMTAVALVLAVLLASGAMLWLRSLSGVVFSFDPGTMLLWRASS